MSKAGVIATWIVSLGLSVLLMRGLLLGAGTPPTPAALEPPLARDAVPIRVDVYEYGLNPRHTVISAGQAVAFRNVGKEIHEIAAANGAGDRWFDAAEQLGRVRVTFRTPGIYPIYCIIHPQIAGRIEVRKHLASPAS